MISRGEVAGLAVAAVGHGVLFVLLGLGFLAADKPPAMQTSMEVSLVDKVGLEMAAPEISSEAQGGKPEEFDAPDEPEPAPAEPDPQPIAKPEPPKPASSSNIADPRRDRSNASESGTGTGGRGRRGGLNLDLTNNDKGEGTSEKPPARMTGEAAANIRSAIQRQIQPCADRQVSPGPGAERILAKVRLRINRDGSLARPPEIIDHSGVDDTNRLYVRRVDDAVKAIFAGCAPLRGLPDELYDVPGGWSVFVTNYRLKA